VEKSACSFFPFSLLVSFLHKISSREGRTFPSIPLFARIIPHDSSLHTFTSLRFNRLISYPESDDILQPDKVRRINVLSDNSISIISLIIILP
jgi:hypothetical protein